MIKSLLILLACCGLGRTAFSQKSISEGGMDCSWKISGSNVEITIKAPTKGWLAIGFNKEDNIVKSDLLMFRVRNGNVESRDMYVVGFGNPKTDTSLGGTNDIENLIGEESGNHTTVSFTVPLDSSDKYDLQKKIGENVWMILAYSVSDDFDHHSRMRKHVEVKF